MFNPIYVEAKTIDDAWFQLLSACYEKGRKYLITEGSHAGEHRLALDDASGFIHYPHTRPLAPILPEGIPIPTTDDKIDQYFATYLMNGELEANEDYKYGTFINGGLYRIPGGITLYDARNALGYVDRTYDYMPVRIPNQVEWIIKHFKEKGFGNEHCYITIGYPESNRAYDIPYKNETERKTSPCLRGLDFRIIEENTESVKYIYCPDDECSYRSDFLGYGVPTTELEPYCPECGTNVKHKFYTKPYLLTKVIYRSWDLWGGFPENMAGFTLLNEYIANELEIEPGPLSFTCKSLHCYEHHTEVLKMRLHKD